MQDVLAPYVNHVVGMNLSRPNKMELTRILHVGGDFFTVKTKPGRLHFPFRWIMEVSQAEGVGFQVGRETVPLLIIMYHLVVYGGGTYVGFAMNFDV